MGTFSLLLLLFLYIISHILSLKIFFWVFWYFFLSQPTFLLLKFPEHGSKISVSHLLIHVNNFESLLCVKYDHELQKRWDISQEPGTF